MSLKAVGPSEDLEINYIKKPTMMLPDPPGIPFNKQGVPIYFDQPHTSHQEILQATTNTRTDPLPFQRFVGVGLNNKRPKQINQPDFLGVNETIYG